MERITTYFTNWWVPALWLSPTINIWENNGTVRITDWALYEIAWGFYWYSFDNYSNDKIYLYRIDGWNTLSDWDRYIFGNNELDSYSYKYSWGRTAAPIANYTPHLSKIEERFDKIPIYDDTEIKKSLQKIEKMLPKKEKDTITPVLIELKNKVSVIENLIWTMWSTDEIMKLSDSLDLIKNRLIREIKDIEISSTNVLEKSTKKIQLELEDKISKIPDSIITKYDERELQQRQDNEVFAHLKDIEDTDQSILSSLHSIGELVGEY